ncbi:MAG: glycine zipper family protein [Gluconacetobacter diazotrophicus]|nr:glycine zipper family protein [Gluconacetobacter diazotrophicus]
MRPLPVLAVATSGLLALSACTVTPPPGPSILAQPGKGKTFQQFQAEDQRCRQYAAQANGGVTPGEAANRSGLGSAVIGTLLGTAAGALIGAAAGNPGIGAAAGAGGGLLLGGAVGSDRAQASGARFQQNYDAAYAQCTQASGNVIALPGVVEYGNGAYAPALVGAPATVVQPPPVLVQPAPVVVQPAPVVVQPAPYGY